MKTCHNHLNDVFLQCFEILTREPRLLFRENFLDKRIIKPIIEIDHTLELKIIAIIDMLKINYNQDINQLLNHKDLFTEVKKIPGIDNCFKDDEGITEYIKRLIRSKKAL